MYSCIIKNENVFDITDKIKSFIHYNENTKIYWSDFFDTIPCKHFDFTQINSFSLIIYKNNNQEIHLNIKDIYYNNFIV